MNPAELQAQYVAILHFKDVILEWIRLMPQDAAHNEFLAGMRELYNQRVNVYAMGGGEGHCPPV